MLAQNVRVARAQKGFANNALRADWSIRRCGVIPQQVSYHQTVSLMLEKK